MRKNQVFNRNYARISHAKTIRFGLAILSGGSIFLGLLSADTRADQFIGHQNGREVVVHTNPIPVILHRLVPPNVGRHVTAREYHATRQSKNNWGISNAHPR